MPQMGELNSIAFAIHEAHDIRRKVRNETMNVTQV